MSTTSSLWSVKQELVAKINRIKERLDSLAASLPEKLEDFAEAEERIRVASAEVGRHLLQAWSETADAKTPTPICDSCQSKMRHKGYVKRSLVTTMGDLRVRRLRYRCSCGVEKYPHDQWLRFLGHSVSPTLAKVIARMGAQLPFDTARENLLLDYHVRLAKRTVQLVSEEAGQAIIQEEDRQRQHIESLPIAEQPTALPDSDLLPEVTYVLADGAMLHSAGDWREIRVGSVASINQQGEEIAVDHRARFLACDDFGRSLLLMARANGYHNARLKAFVADGARWLWDQAATHFPDAIQILDWYHLSEHIHDTANELYGQGTSQSKRFSKQRLKELWEGRSSQTLRRLKEIRKKLRSKSKRESLRKLIGYLKNNRERINYPNYRELGLQVGSGRVEAACKSLVAGRCKQSGMRNWTRNGAEGVLRIRAALQTSQYDQLWKNHFQTAV